MRDSASPAAPHKLVQSSHIIDLLNEVNVNLSSLIGFLMLLNEAILGDT